MTTKTGTNVMRDDLIIADSLEELIEKINMSEEEFEEVCVTYDRLEHSTSRVNDKLKKDKKMDSNEVKNKLIEYMNSNIHFYEELRDSLLLANSFNIRELTTFHYLMTVINGISILEGILNNEDIIIKNIDDINFSKH